MYPPVRLLELDAVPRRLLNTGRPSANGWKPEYLCLGLIVAFYPCLLAARSSEQQVTIWKKSHHHSPSARAERRPLSIVPDKEHESVGDKNDMDCPYCERRLRALSMRCRVCSRYVPRWPHIIAISLIAI